MAVGLAVAAFGASAQARPISAGELASLPPRTVDVTFQTEHGTMTGHYAGPLLWSVLGTDGLLPAGAPKTRLIHSVVVTGRDGYAVAVAIGEIDPFFEGKDVILATRQDGHAIGGGEVRLIVPGDKHGGRAVRDVVAVEVR